MKFKNWINEQIEKSEAFHGNIEKETLDNFNFRKVIYTGKNSQLVVMSLKPGEEIGEEVHDKIDQFFRFELGKGKVLVNNKEYNVKNGDAILVPAGTTHNVKNIGKEYLKFYTIYSPPHHERGLINKNKND